MRDLSQPIQCDRRVSIVARDMMDHIPQATAFFDWPAERHTLAREFLNDVAYTHRGFAMQIRISATDARDYVEAFALILTEFFPLSAVLNIPGGSLGLAKKDE